MLARIFAAQSGGSIIDDAEQLPESEIFHRWNLAQEERRPLLIVTLETPPALEAATARPCLAAGGDTARYHWPADDQLFDMLLAKFLAQRGLSLPPDVAAYLRVRADRSYVTIMRLADALDEPRCRAGRITTALARDVLSAMGMMPVERPLPDLLD